MAVMTAADLVLATLLIGLPLGLLYAATRIRHQPVETWKGDDGE